MSVLLATAAEAVTPWSYDANWEAPSDYYSTAAGLTGTALRNQLHLIIEKDYFSNGVDFSSSANIALHTQHRVNNYQNAGAALDVLDQAGPRAGIFDTKYINFFYEDVDRSLTSGASRNREHVWSSARQQPGTARGDDDEADYADLHNLYWCLSSVNSDKLARNFDDPPVASNPPNYEGITTGGNWYPGEGHKGDVARVSMYMDLRYDGDTSQDPDTYDLELVNGHPAYYSTAQQGDLASMMEWHYADPVDPREMRRNSILFTRSFVNEFGGTETPNNWTTPGNRNAFVDRPEYAHAIFVDNANDTQLYVDAPAADGSSAETVELGPVIVGAPVPGSQTVTLHKTGNDGTYYQVTVSGDATCDVSGHYNAFEMNASGQRVLTVGLENASTASAGLQQGTVTIDNLDVTTGGGSGRGGNDGDDVITVQMSVLSHSNGSFAAGYDDNTLTLDFGSIAEGSGPQQLGFDVYNTLGLAGYTADMIVTAVGGTGDTGELTTSFDATDVIAGSGSSSFWAYLDTAAAGTYSATWTFSTADEALPGSASGADLVLTLLAEVTAATLPGDFNGNGVLDAGDIDLLSAAIGGGDLGYDLNEDGQVTGADKDMLVGNLIGTFYGDADLDLDVDDDDFDLLKGNYDASAGWAGGDFDGDGTISLGDLGMLSANFGQLAAGGSTVPEPATLALLGLGGVAALIRRRRA